MRLPAQSKIQIEDLKDAPKWASGLVDPLNSFMATVYQCLSKNVSLADNINCQVREFTYTTLATYPSGQPNLTIASELKSKATGLFLMQAIKKDDYTPVLSVVYIPWVENNGNIIIYPITGLAISTTYTIRVVIF